MPNHKASPVVRLTAKQRLALRWQGLMLILFPATTITALADGLVRELSREADGGHA